LLERFASDLGEVEALALADALNRRAPLAVRVNTGKIERAALLERLSKEGVRRSWPRCPRGTDASRAG
jgi:16S rRNA C967 or C1407 C5-methylase (RsmB/RsmF family)